MKTIAGQLIKVVFDRRTKPEHDQIQAETFAQREIEPLIRPDVNLRKAFSDSARDKNPRSIDVLCPSKDNPDRYWRFYRVGVDDSNPKEVTAVFRCTGITRNTGSGKWVFQDDREDSDSEPSGDSSVDLPERNAKPKKRKKDKKSKQA